MKAMKPGRFYPDIGDILARKARGRRTLAALSFTEKLAILDRLRETAAPLYRARALQPDVNHQMADSRKD